MPRRVSDPEACQALWERLIPPETIWDLWDVRDCFHRAFARPLCFLVDGEDGPSPSFLPLAWVEESGCWQLFPGETWTGRTWLERNRLLAPDDEAVAALLAARPGPVHLRYLLPCAGAPSVAHRVDELNYRFLPADHGFVFERYLDGFSRRFRRKLEKELAHVTAGGVAVEEGDLSDAEPMVAMSLSRFGTGSYFHDPRMRAGFRNLFHLLAERGWLRVTRVVLGGEVAAIDLGALHGGTYTLLAGATHAGHPGVAKVINLHHLRVACQRRDVAVDFLCGDFSWKGLFRLTARPLHLISEVPALAGDGHGAPR